MLAFLRKMAGNRTPEEEEKIKLAVERHSEAAVRLKDAIRKSNGESVQKLFEEFLEGPDGQRHE